MSRGLYNSNNNGAKLNGYYIDVMPSIMDKPETIVKLGEENTCKTKSHSRKYTSTTNANISKDDTSNNSSSGLVGLLGRLWCGLRKGRGDSDGLAGSGGAHATGSGAILESGGVVVGSVKNLNAFIPADVMFSPRRAALYSRMLTMLIHNPYYLSRIIHSVKHYECDGLLAILLDSLFVSQAHELALTSLFSEIIKLEIGRTSSIDTVMRNDASSVHMLSAYLKKQSCLDYLQLAVGPTIETILGLGNVSLDPELASAYQDWVRSLGSTRRLPPVVGAVEAASYTEVQNLSRRRQRYISHIAAHCLYDIISTRHRIPAGLLSICASTLSATKSKFPQVDETKAYSLVGGIFFLRFINAALTSPNHYGLLKDEPVGTVKTNLKLVARLIQRLSNYSAKPPEEWPLDSRKFIKGNVNRFHRFLASLTSNERDDDGGKLFDILDGRNEDRDDDGNGGDDERSQETSVSPPPPPQGGSVDVGGVSVYKIKSMPRPSRHRKHEKKEKRRMSRHQQLRNEIISLNTTRSRLVPSDTAGEEGGVRRTRTKKQQSIGASQDAADASSTNNNATIGSSSADAGSNVGNSGESASTGTSTTGSLSVDSIYGNLGHREHSEGEVDDNRRQRQRQPSRSGGGGGAGDGNSVTLPLNDLYLLQKYLALYSDAWMPNESTNSRRLVVVDLADGGQQRYSAGGGDSNGEEEEGQMVPMQRCLESLEDPPPLVSLANNHRTRISLASCD
ncbi:RasGAP protein [Coemansia sp. RSA 1200]|nr:RasGAP protein [Coemansia sp. RSA 1200]